MPKPFEVGDRVVITKLTPEWKYWNPKMDCRLGQYGEIEDVIVSSDPTLTRCRVQFPNETGLDSFWYFPAKCLEFAMLHQPSSLVKSFVAEEPEYTGGSVSYYTVHIANPTTEGVEPYDAECNDIIEALGMNYAEGNAFKAIWRRAAARTGKVKKGYTDGLYDAQKVVFFGERMVIQEEAASGSQD